MKKILSLLLTTLLFLFFSCEDSGTDSVAVGDAYEPDGSYDTASIIDSFPTVQSHTFHDDDEEDFYKIFCTNGESYTVTLSYSSTDITGNYMELRNESYQYLNLGEKTITFTATYTGAYYVWCQADDYSSGPYDITFIHN